MIDPREAFARPPVHTPVGAYEPVRLGVVRVLRGILSLLPASLVTRSPWLRRFSTRLELAELWRTDLLAWRVRRGRLDGMRIGSDCRLYSLNIASEAELVELGDRVIVSGDVVFVTHDGGVFLSRGELPGLNGHYGRIRIGSDCFLGMRAIILPGVELGERCIVAAGAVVMDSFPANSVIAGNPATYVSPTGIYLALKRHSRATVIDPAYPFPLKYPPALLVSHLADAPFKRPRRRRATDMAEHAGHDHADVPPPVPAPPTSPIASRDERARTETLQ